MRRFFRVVDCTRHMGLPVRAACIILNLLSCPLYVFTLFFLPLGAAIPFMIAEGGIGLVGLIASVTRIRVLTLLYIICQSLMIIPVYVVIGYIMYTIINWGYTVCYYDYYWNTYSCPYLSYSDYQIWLFRQSLGLLWVVMIAGFIGSIIATMAIGGFRKLRLFQSGVHTVTQGGRRAVVVQQQPATVYTVPQPQQTTVYQTTTTYGAQPQQYAQQVYPPYPQQPPQPQPVYAQPGYQPHAGYSQQYQPQPAYPQQAMMPPTMEAPPKYS